MAANARNEPPVSSGEPPSGPSDRCGNENNPCHGLDRKPIGIKSIDEKRRQRDNTTPQPWILQKITILLVVGLIGLATYVYIGRVCVPMIRQDNSALGSRTLGIIYLCIFCPLLLMTLWTYIKVVLTPPGFARDHCTKAPPPQPPTVAGPRYGATHQWDVDTFDESIQSWDHNSESQGRLSPQVSMSVDHDSEPPAAQGQGNHSAMMPVYPLSPKAHADDDTNEEQASDVREMDAIPAVASKRAKSHLNPPHNGQPGGLSPPQPPNTLPAAARTSSSLPPPLLSRRPPRHPVLAEEYRYCTRDGFIKPMRAHHCRICATCVLNFDHHCPWIGQCVGARNRKFFVNFVFWAALFTIFVAISLIIINARPNNRRQDLDPLQIVIIVLGSLFGLFTSGLFFTHTYLIMLNMTTVEQYSVQNMVEREHATLDQMLPWWDCFGRKRLLRKWDEEWGALRTEGNIWNLGSRRKNWEATMGNKVLWWFLPIGRSEGDGLTYPINPRFTSEGKWRRRKDWPEELR
ncbi:palmitoyltransferase pfa5 [Tulasnella sp. 418]|nr:palmitoyltransferase pfa5 [Tulasnella sp. 418]